MKWLMEKFIFPIEIGTPVEREGKLICLKNVSEPHHTSVRKYTLEGLSRKNIKLEEFSGWINQIRKKNKLLSFSFPFSKKISFRNIGFVLLHYNPSYFWSPEKNCTAVKFPQVSIWKETVSSFLFSLFSYYFFVR